MIRQTIILTAILQGNLQLLIVVVTVPLNAVYINKYY